MKQRSYRQQRQAEVGKYLERQLWFWSLLCLVGFPILGWPLLIVWFGLLWSVCQFHRVLFDAGTRKEQKGKSKD